MYIVISKHTVLLYHNSSLWLDTQDASSCVCVSKYIYNDYYHVYVQLNYMISIVYIQSLIISGIYIYIYVITMTRKCVIRKHREQYRPY